MPTLPRPRKPFRWSALHGRALHRLLAGLLLMTVAAAYGSWGLRRLAHRGAERDAFDRPVVAVAERLVLPPDVQPAFEPATDNERLLLAVITDQQDALFGLTVLLLRALLIAVVAGFGLVLLTAGSTEWEVRSERTAVEPTN